MYVLAKKILHRRHNMGIWYRTAMNCRNTNYNNGFIRVQTTRGYIRLTPDLIEQEGRWNTASVDNKSVDTAY